MKYKEFKVLLEQSAPNTVSIIVYFEDNTTQVVDDIPLQYLIVLTLGLNSKIGY